MASELAHKELARHFKFNSNLIYKEVSDDVSIYTEEAQDLFNILYDEFYDLLWNLKEE